jgi:hypothetical protein
LSLHARFLFVCGANLDEAPTMIRLNYRSYLALLTVLVAFSFIAPSRALVVSQSTASHTPHGPFMMEQLGRGLVAVRTTATQIYVGWRLLGTDEDGIAFNLYRSTNDGTPQKLNTEPIAATTDFVDAAAPMDVASYTYVVRPVVDGVEQAASEPFTLSAIAPPQQYLRVSLDRPEGGVEGGFAFTYNANDASVADLNGDGKYEIVIKWEPSNPRDSSQDGFTGPNIFDAYALDGTRLWRIHLGINLRAGPHHVQFLVYDLDGDGRAEFVTKTAPGTKDGLGNFVANPAKFFGEYPTVVDHAADYRNGAGRPLTGPEFLTIFDGLTGEELASTRFFPERHPDTDFPTGPQLFSIWGDSFGNRVERLYAGIGYLDGHRPSLVWGRGYAKGQQGHPGRIAIGAWNWRNGQLTALWRFDSRGHASENAITGQGAHSLSIADLTGDGRHDIVYGQLWVGADGELLRTGWGHGDALHVSNMDPDRPGQHVFQPHESASQYGPNALSFDDGLSRQLIWGVTATGDIGRGVAADVDPRFRGYEMWGSGTTGGLYTAQRFQASASGPRGTQVSPRKPSSINHVVWWTDDLLRELLDGITISKWNWETEATDVLLAPSGIASNNGTKANPSLQADIVGDWREEVVWRESDSAALRIYTTTIPAEQRLYTLMHDHQYRVAIAWQNVGYNQPPHPSFYLGDGMARQARPNIIVERDTTAPVVASVAASPTVLWPPNHEMREIVATVNATDDIDPHPITTIVEVTSNEPELGAGSGDYAPDWEITGDLTLRLRAERSGLGSGRVYTIKVQSIDFFGNESVASTTVRVPLR